MYHIYLCLDGIKSKYVEQIYIESREEFESVIENMPFDIIDADDHNCWVDYGDE